MNRNSGDAPPQSFGKYRLISGVRLPNREPIFMVYEGQCIDPISRHETERDARAAIKRYQAADARRASNA